MMSAIKLRLLNASSFSRISNTQLKSNADAGQKYRKFSSETDSSASEDGNNNKKSKYLDKNAKNMNERANATKERSYNRTDKINSVRSNDKPLFITTVKSGKFLDPPPALAYLLGLQNNLSCLESSPNDSTASCNGFNKKRNQKQVFLYSFSSRPRVLNHSCHKSKCEAAAKVAATDEANHGGSRFSNSKESRFNNSPNFEPKVTQNHLGRGGNFVPCPVLTNSDSQTTRQQQARRRALARRRAQGGCTRLGTPPPVKGRHHEIVQTDVFLEELLIDTSKTEAECQTELFSETPPSKIYSQQVCTAEAQTQIDEGELLDLGAEIEAVLPGFVEKIVEESLLEVLIEEEEEALRVQHLLKNNEIEVKEQVNSEMKFN